MRCLLDPDASTVGLYTPDRYFMVIMKAALDGGPDPLVFVHEYWHYLQNISTLHGLKSFEITQQLVPLFSATMNADGTSRGSDGLSDAQRERLVRFLAYRAALDGDIGPSHDNDIKGEVVELHDDYITFETRWPGIYTHEQLKLRLGARAIKESIAHLVECHVARLIASPEPSAPEFPYAILTRLSAFLTGTDLHPLLIAALGTLALLTNDPARTFCRATTAYRMRARPSDAIDESCLRAIADEFAVSELHEALAVVKIADLPSIKAIHVTHGTSEKAVAFVVDETQRALERRAFDPLFDIRNLLLFAPGADPILSLIDMMKADFLPCDMEFAGRVRSFYPETEDEVGLDLSQYLRSFQAQQEFMMVHVNATGDGFSPSSAVSVPCSFRRCCTHPNRTVHSDYCARTPWRQYKEASVGCWYVNGVAATIGPHTIRKIMR